MRCQRCEFENMPGLTTCMRCGSVLQSGPAKIEVHPPRSPAWKKPLRGFRRGLRQLKPAPAWTEPEQATGQAGWLQTAVRVNFLGAFLSIIPGFAHLVQGRFYAIHRWVLAWLTLLLSALFFYGSVFGLMLLGLAIGVHVWIALHSAFLAEYEDLRARIWGFLLILIFFFIGYMAVGRLLFYNYRGGYAVAHVPARQVHRGDYLLGRRNQIQPEDLTRGSFVLAELSSVHGRRVFRRPEAVGYVQIIGLPGETVGLKENVFYIDDEPLDADRFPVPGWLRGRALTATVPEDSYFVSAQYEGRGYNASQAIDVSLIDRERIAAKAFLRWNPVRRRGFINE